MSQRAFALISVAVGVIALVAGLLAISQRSVSYTAEASVLVVVSDSVTDPNDQVNAIDTLTRGGLQDTLAEALVGDTNVRQAFANGGITTNEAADVSVSASVVASTFKILIFGTSSDPALAERAADAVAGSRPDLGALLGPFQLRPDGIAQGSALKSGPSGSLLVLMTIVVAVGLGLVTFVALRRLGRSAAFRSMVGAIGLDAETDAPVERAAPESQPAEAPPADRSAQAARPAVAANDRPRMAAQRRRRANPRRAAGVDETGSDFDVELDPMPERRSDESGRSRRIAARDHGRDAGERTSPVTPVSAAAAGAAASMAASVSSRTPETTDERSVPDDSGSASDAPGQDAGARSAAAPADGGVGGDAPAVAEHAKAASRADGDTPAATEEPSGTADAVGSDAPSAPGGSDGDADAAAGHPEADATADGDAVGADGPQDDGDADSAGENAEAEADTEGQADGFAGEDPSGDGQQADARSDADADGQAAQESGQDGDAGESGVTADEDAAADDAAPDAESDGAEVDPDAASDEAVADNADTGDGDAEDTDAEAVGAGAAGDRPSAGHRSGRKPRKSNRS